MIVLTLPGARHLGLARWLRASAGAVAVHRFPDREVRVRIATSVQDRDVVLVAGLERPDEKVLPLIFSAATARDLGARSVGLVAPYLPFFRQDRPFAAGEGVSARHFAALLSRAVDWLVTVDPHLHRIRTPSEVFTIPVETVHAAPLIAAWIRDHVAEPLLLGPDAESRQWVGTVAGLARSPYAVFTKRRLGDRRVQLTVPDIEVHAGRQPVLVDDVVASGVTMASAVLALRRHGWSPPICVAVHGVFAAEAYAAIKDAGAKALITTNTIRHPSNAIDVTPLLADAVRRMIGPPTPGDPTDPFAALSSSLHEPGVSVELSAAHDE